MAAMLISLFAGGQSLTGISPGTGVSGTNLNVTISGLNTHFSQATNTAVGFFFSGASSTITFTNTNYPLSNLSLLSNLSIPTGIPDGWYDFAVWNEIDGMMLKPGGFEVKGPKLISIAPNAGKAGEALQVTITGVNTHFTQATNTVVAFYFTGATATATYPTSTNIPNNSTIHANLTIPSTTFPGWYWYSVTNPIDGSLMHPASFQVVDDTGIEDAEGAGEISVYPNPFTDRLNLRTTGIQEEQLVIRFYDVAGVLVEQRTMIVRQNDNALMPEYLTPGVYFLVITRANRSSRFYKVVKH